MLAFFFLCTSVVSATSGTVFIHVSDVSEKQIDSLKVWFSPGNNILESGICLENKLMMLRLQTKDEATIASVYSSLKSHGFQKFYLKEEISMDKYYQNCNSYILFH